MSNLKVNEVMKEEVKECEITVTENGYLSTEQEEAMLRHMRLEYLTCLSQALDEPGDDERTVQITAEYCHETGLPEEFCVCRTTAQRRIALSEDEVRKIFRTVYKQRPVYRVTRMNQKEQIARFIDDFFLRRYQLRYNEVKGIEEFRPNDGTCHEWKPIGERELNRMVYEEMREGGPGWSIDVHLYLRSTKVPTYNPIREFLDGCGRWTGKTDHIGALARRVPTGYADWEPFFHRWFLAMVAGWLNLNPTFGNMLVPMLIGGQGTHKTTFCRMILPPFLREYFIDDIKMDNAEQVERVLARMALVNIDEYNSKTEREQAKIKRLLAEKNVQVRRMRSDQYTLSQRVASFIATTNSPTPLTDPTGSRRYLCCPVEGVIDTSSRLNYRQLYAQALHELSAGARYHLTAQEEARMTEHNQRFTIRPATELALLEFFEPAERAKENLMTLREVEAALRSQLRPADVPPVSKLAAALSQHFQTGVYCGKRGWYLRSVVL